MSAPMLFARFIPNEFKTLLRAISPVAFSVVDWKKVLKDSPLLFKRVVTREGVDELAKTLRMLLPQSVSAERQGLHRDRSAAPHLGQAALELYFAQLFNPKGQFLDLRLKNFSPAAEFTPNGLWIQWQTGFREGLLNIYVGYYLDQPDTLDQGLRQVGLIHEQMQLDQVEAVKAMLLAHIGGNTRQQNFRIGDFTASFEWFFEFLLANKIRLSADFLYLGIYLASLYYCLEETGGTFDVQQTFVKVKAHVEKNN